MGTETMNLGEATQEYEKVARDITSRRARLAALYDSGEIRDGQVAVSPTVAAEMKVQEEALKSLEATKQSLQYSILKFRNAEELERALKEPGLTSPAPFSGAGGIGNGNGKSENGASVKSYDTMADVVLSQPAFKSWAKGGRHTIGEDMSLKDFDAALKAPITSTGLTAYERVPSVYGQLQQTLRVRDLLATGETDATTIRYLQETTRTSTVDVVAEAAAKPEQVFAFAEVDAPVRKIAGYTKISDEMVNDYAGIRSFINAQLPFEVMKKEEQQLLNGTGVGQQITGILNTANIQTQAFDTNNADTVFKAMMKIMSVGFLDPDGIVLHPNNWQTIRLLKTTTGEYIWGPPSQVGPNTLFGLPVAVTTAITANTGLVGSFRRSAQIYFREGVRVEMTNADQDDFVKNLITIRGEERLALTVYYPKGFCTVTSLT